jgi:5-bromo-4-chloroindolyl phosphate hydrolysis protein
LKIVSYYVGQTGGFLVEKFLAFLVTLLSGVVIYLLAPWNWMISMAISIGGMLIIWGVMEMFRSRIWDKDARFIKNTLKDAGRKNRQIRAYGDRWRLWRLWFKIRHIAKVNQKIIDTVGRFPERFPRAEKFFNLYLDLILNVLEKYSILVNQPVRTPEVAKSLRETEEMLTDVIAGLEQQLTHILDNEIKELEVEKEILRKYI